MHDQQKRNQLLLWVIALGLVNFVAYTLIYWYLGGDAPNGFVEDGVYHLRGHFLWALSGKPTDPVSRNVWLYSFVHSISIWPTIAAVLASMLFLARPHIEATMNINSPTRGSVFVVSCFVVIGAVTSLSTLFFVLGFIRALQTVASGGAYNP